MFWSSIRSTKRGWQLALHTCDSNNLARLIVDHMLNQAFEMQKWTMDIDIKHAQMVRKVIIAKLWSHWYSGILNNNIYFFPFSLKFSNNFCCHILYLIKICHIQFHDIYFLFLCALILDSFELFKISSTNYYLSP